MGHFPSNVNLQVPLDASKMRRLVIKFAIGLADLKLGHVSLTSLAGAWPVTAARPAKSSLRAGLVSERVCAAHAL